MTRNRAAGVVVIGRNEGERLRACLRSVLEPGRPVVYVDSGSSDGSPRVAESLGAEVLELDRERPFSAARARNEGFELLRARHPEVAYVQFVDGDSALSPAWLERGIVDLERRREVVAVCGHLRERDPERNVYTRLCALEWERTPGEIRDFGGIFLVRAESFAATGGFRADMIAGEEAELCIRLRSSGGRIVHVDAEMAVHDVGMTRFAQWWRRARRTGHTYAQGYHMHGRGIERHLHRECRSTVVWGLAIPVLVLALAIPTSGASLLLLAAFPLQIVRTFLGVRRRGWTRRDAALYATFVVAAKFPETMGMLDYVRSRLRGRTPATIEYKDGGSAS